VQIENEFVVPTPVHTLWAFLLDVERIAPCMPGAELTEIVDDTTWKGKLKAKFGPVAMNFAGTVTLLERDDAAHRVVLKAQGMETKGKGAATATVTSWLEPASGDDTTVKMQADINLSGLVAQVSRGLLPDVSAKLTQQFADCLKSTLDADDASSAAAADPGAQGAPVETAGKSSPAVGTSSATKTAAPAAVGGLRLGLWAIGKAITRFVRRLFGKRTDD